jgi:hypothetical protein
MVAAFHYASRCNTREVLKGKKHLGIITGLLKMQLECYANHCYSYFLD